MKSTLIIWLASAASAAHCQTLYRNAADLSDLFERVSGSDYVVKAKLNKGEWVFPQPSKEALERLRQDEEAASKSSGGIIHFPYDHIKAGELFTLTVTESLCRKADFLPGSRERARISGPVYFFVPWREMGSDSIAEYFSSGISYLVFLERDPAQAQFGSLYQIDTARTYYRAHLRSRGVVQLSTDADTGKPNDPATPLLTAVKALCDAVKPSDNLTKIANLTSLRDATSDPGLRRSAAAAISALQADPGKPQ